MLSLNPRFDLFHFEFPKAFIPEPVLEKYQRILNQNPGVLYDPVQYLNESIQGVSIPGLKDLTDVIQPQTSTNTIERTDSKGRTSLGRINREPAHDNIYYTVQNPLKNTENTFKVTLRQNQGLYNYWMLYESVYLRITKPNLYDKGDDVFHIDILDEIGQPTARIFIYQPHVTEINGLEFSFSKLERSTDTFDVSFIFNNIDFDIINYTDKYKG